MRQRRTVVKTVNPAGLATALHRHGTKTPKFFHVATGLLEESSEGAVYGVTILLQAGERTTEYRVTGIDEANLEGLVKIVWETLQRSPKCSVPSHVLAHFRDYIGRGKKARLIFQNDTLRISVD